MSTAQDDPIAVGTVPLSVQLARRQLQSHFRSLIPAAGQNTYSPEFPADERASPNFLFKEGVAIPEAPTSNSHLLLSEPEHVVTLDPPLQGTGDITINSRNNAINNEIKAELVNVVASLPISTTPKKYTPRLLTEEARKIPSPVSHTGGSNNAERKVKVALPAPKRVTASRKKSASGIPLRMKSGSSAGSTPRPTPVKTGTSYNRQPTTQQVNTHHHHHPAINKNSLEVQFLNNKKRLIMMHAEIAQKQRPLLEMHKSLVRTQKQLEELGKKVTLDDLKVVTFKMSDENARLIQLDQLQKSGGGETVPNEVVIDLKSSVDGLLESFLKVCKKCLSKRSEEAIKMLESVSRAEVEPGDVAFEIESLRRDKNELQKLLEGTVKENEKKIEEIKAQWNTLINGRCEDATTKLKELEEKIAHQQKSISDAEENANHLSRKYEEKRANLEKVINELQDKILKLEEDVRKEKKNSSDYLMKSRNLRSKSMDLEAKTKEAEEKCADATTKYKQLQEQTRKKELQWVKEKDELKKNEALLQQKFTEKQTSLDARLKDMETVKEIEDEKLKVLLAAAKKDLVRKEQELQILQKEKQLLEEGNKEMEDKIEGLEIKVKELLNRKTEIYQVPEHYAGIENQWIELLEFKQKISEGQKTIQAQNDKITEMQASLKSHAQIIVSLKLEKDNAVKYSGKLRELLQEARDEIDYKNKTIYKIHEKLVFKQTECEKLRSDLKDMQLGSEYYGRRSSRSCAGSGGKCDLCSASVGGRTGDCGSFYDSSSVATSKVGKNMSNYMSESLIGMSVKKVDNIRAKIDNLKKLRLPSVGLHKKRVFSKMNCSFSNHSCHHHHHHTNNPTQAKAYNTLRKQLEIRGRLYEFLQKRADETCDDFYDLLKTTLSCTGKGELKPSNVSKTDEGTEYGASNINITRSFRTVAHYDQAYPEMYDEIDEIFAESDD